MKRRMSHGHATRSTLAFSRVTHRMRSRIVPRARRPPPGSMRAVLILSRVQVEELLDLDALVDAVGHAIADLSAGSASMPPRVAAEAARLAELLAASTATPVHAMPSIEEAIEGADVVCACTHAEEPVVRRAWLRPGAHVASVGLNPQGREVDAETVRDAVVVVESRASALAPFPAGA